MGHYLKIVCRFDYGVLYNLVMETTQSKIKSLLGKAGIPAKEIQVFGSSIIVTCYSEEAARKFGHILAAAKIKVRGVVSSMDGGQKVWRVGGAI